jgi:hypothetical protein
MLPNMYAVCIGYETSLVISTYEIHAMSTCLKTYCIEYLSDKNFDLNTSSEKSLIEQLKSIIVVKNIKVESIKNEKRNKVHETIIIIVK